MSQILDLFARQRYSQTFGDEGHEIGFEFHVLQNPGGEPRALTDAT